MDITKHDNYYEYVIQALKDLGGSGSNEEILNKVIEVAGLTEEQAEQEHSGVVKATAVDYTIGWTKTYLKKLKYLENSSRGVWSLTKESYAEKLATNDEIKSRVKKIIKEETINKKISKVTDSMPDKSQTSGETDNNEITGDANDDKWIADLIARMLQLTPTGFERLCQRIFREKGFSKVTVTKKTGDGGIDGIGIMKISLMSFKVLFQCKRYEESVGSGAIRDFRGALSGRADKGIFLTTGRFTKSAKDEAERDGAEPIELIDGIELCHLLKELELGVSIKTKEIITINNDFFNNF